MNMENSMESDISDEIKIAFAGHQYMPLEKIGEGGFFIAFKAINQKTAQIVTLKVLKNKKNQIARLNCEVELCAKLNHPYIVTLLDKGQVGRIHFSVFEFVNGRSLKDELFELGAMTPMTATDIMSQVLLALSHAHQRGIVHRDVKPDNIMLNKQEQKIYVKLIDFGISALVVGEQVLIGSDHSMDHTTGTLSYVAPEQLQGCIPIPKSDIYAWGLVFIECLTGTRVMSGTCQSSIIQQQLSLDDIVLPKEIENHPIAQIIKLATKKDVKKRCDNAIELFEKLSHINVSTLAKPKSNAPLTDNDNKQSKTQQINQTLMFKHYHQLMENAPRQATTALCIIITLRSHSTKQRINGEPVEKVVLQRLYEEKKNQCVSLAQKFGATIAGRLVDTLLFYFDDSKTCKTHILICAKAALKMLKILNQPTTLNNTIKISCTVQIGMHSGSFSLNHHKFPEEDIPRTAMTLARSAGANQILCSRSTHELLNLQSDFETTYINKNYQNNAVTPSYAILREKGKTTVDSMRFETDILSLIGYTEALTKLENITMSTSLNRRCAHVQGEQGIGKSRIMAELCLKMHDSTVWSMECIPENKNNEMSIFIRLFKRMFALYTGDEEISVLKIKSLLEEHPNIEVLRSTAILCSWLNLTSHEKYPTSTTVAKSIQAELFKILTFLLCKNSSVQLSKHAIFIIDDIHWLDESSLDFVAEFISSDAFKQSGHALITSSIQSLPANLYGRITTTIKLNRFDRKCTATLVAACLSGQQASNQLIELIYQRTEGIPLLIIEFVKMLKQKNYIQRLNGKISLVKQNDFPYI